MPKHTVGEQLLDVRRDKRERQAYEAIDGRTAKAEETFGEFEDEDAEPKSHVVAPFEA